LFSQKTFFMAERVVAYFDIPIDLQTDLEAGGYYFTNFDFEPNNAANALPALELSAIEARLVPIAEIILGTPGAATIPNPTLFNLTQSSNTSVSYETFPGTTGNPGVDNVTVVVGGKRVADKEIVVEEINKGGIMPSVDTSTITPLPVFKADNVTDGNIAVVELETELDSLAGKKIADIVFVKLLSAGTGVVEFPNIGDSGAFFDGSFLIADSSGNALNNNAVVASGTTYKIKIGIKDDGEYDWDSAEGEVIDPSSLVSKSSGGGDGGSGSGGGGCNTGAFGFVGVAIMGLIAAAKYKKRGRL
jgi:hypothetical protein